MNQASLPGPIVWKSELLFRGVKYTPELSEAVAEGAAPDTGPIARSIPTALELHASALPVQARSGGGTSPRERGGAYEVRRRAPTSPLGQRKELCDVEFVRAHAFQSFRTTDGSRYMDAGVEQLGDMLVVNLTPGCEYFMTKSSCSFCGYGRFSPRTQALGQIPGVIQPARRLWNASRKCWPMPPIPARVATSISGRLGSPSEDETGAISARGGDCPQVRGR